MADKTREELKQQIAVLQQELEQKKKDEAISEPVEVLTKIRTALIDQGFTSEEAFQLVLTMLQSQN